MSSADGKAGGCPGEGTDRPSPACGSASRGRGHCASLCAGRQELRGASAVQVPGGQEPLRIWVQPSAGEPFCTAHLHLARAVVTYHCVERKLLLALPSQQDRGEVLEASLRWVLTDAGCSGVFPVSSGDHKPHRAQRSSAPGGRGCATHCGSIHLPGKPQPLMSQCQAALNRQEHHCACAEMPAPKGSTLAAQELFTRSCRLPSGLAVYTGPIRCAALLMFA